MKYSTILFDFDGVLCREHFYVHTLLPEHADVVDWIQFNIFGNSELVEKWMRGHVTSEEINQMISESCAIEAIFLQEKFLESVRLMQLDKNVVRVVQNLRSQGKKVGLVTNNMDVFSTVTIKNHKLDELFDAIVNSSDYGILKKDVNGRLFDIALTRLGSIIDNSILIDDSSVAVDLYRKKGGLGLLYTEFEGLKKYLD